MSSPRWNIEKKDQLVIPFTYNEDNRFENFTICPGNRDAYLSLFQLRINSKNQSVFYLYGEKGTGKTHLVRAFITSSQEKDALFHFFYISFADNTQNPKQQNINSSLNDIVDKNDLLVLEDVDRLSEDSVISQNIFDLFNNFFNHNKLIIITSRCSPAAITNLHRRLCSRFAAGVVVKVGLLDENTCREILKKIALDRNALLSEKVINYILVRTPRNPASLQSLFQKLDQRALQLKKPITINLVRKILNESAES